MHWCHYFWIPNGKFGPKGEVIAIDEEPEGRRIRKPAKKTEMEDAIIRRKHSKRRKSAISISPNPIVSDV